jgi:predicted DCC family thiol-disulfide oxidoreductase YuxK
MDALIVLYDARCSLCRQARSWLAAQPAYVELVFVAAGSETARRQFPQLDHAATTKDLTVISSAGAVYCGPNAWLMCLWALREYRTWSLTLSSAEMLPLARRLIIWISQNRFRIGAMLPGAVLHALVHGEPSGDECAEECTLR